VSLEYTLHAIGFVASSACNRSLSSARLIGSPFMKNRPLLSTYIDSVSPHGLVRCRTTSRCCSCIQRPVCPCANSNIAKLIHGTRITTPHASPKFGKLVIGLASPASVQRDHVLQRHFGKYPQCFRTRRPASGAIADLNIKKIPATPNETAENSMSKCKRVEDSSPSICRHGEKASTTRTGTLGT
jgi:hypothetical protein